MIIVFGEMIDLFVTTGGVDDLLAALQACGVLDHLGLNYTDVASSPSIL